MDDRTVYFGSNDGSFHALEAASGTEQINAFYESKAFAPVFLKGDALQQSLADPAVYADAEKAQLKALLLEKAELTSGSTWHAAGGMHTLNGDPNVAKLQAYRSAYPDIMAEVADLLSGSVVGKTVDVQIWRVPAAEIPAGDQRRRWLFDWWKRVDDFVGA